VKTGAAAEDCNPQLGQPHLHQPLSLDVPRACLFLLQLWMTSLSLLLQPPLLGNPKSSWTAQLLNQELRSLKPPFHTAWMLLC